MNAIHIVILILTTIVALLLIGIVLIQKSKGGGLSSQFGGASATIGVRQTNNFLEKGTWTLAILILVFSVAAAFTTPRQKSGVELRTKTESKAPAPAANQFETQAQDKVVVPVEEGKHDNAAPANEGEAETVATPAQTEN